jgi:hypothetical protein
LIFFQGGNFEVRERKMINRFIIDETRRSFPVPMVITIVRSRDGNGDTLTGTTAWIQRDELLVDGSRVTSFRKVDEQPKTDAVADSTKNISP